jgi:hypothetical protein
MKPFVRMLAVAALAGAATIASARDLYNHAGDNPYPSSGIDNYSQADVFPNMETYRDAHRGSIATQASVPGPASVPEEYPLSSEFPGMTTYQDEHRNSIATQASVPDPASVPEEYPLSSEFPGMTTYQDEHEDAAVGATR